MDHPSAERILNAISELQIRFAAQPDAADSFKALLENLLQLTQSSYGLIVEIGDGDSGKFDLRLHEAAGPENRTSPVSSMSAERLVHFALEHGMPRVISEAGQLAEDLRFQTLLNNAFIFPLCSAHKVLAVLMLADGMHGYSEELIKSLQPLLTFSAIVAGLCHEARARNSTEEALRESQLQLRQVIDLVPHHLFAIVPARGGRFIFANKALAELYGLTTEEVVGKTQRDITPVAAEEEHFLADDFEVIQSGKMKFIPEEVYTDPFGRVHYLQTTKIPFKAVGSNEPAVLGICVDITAQKRAEEERMQLEEQFRHAQKLESLGLIAGGIAHDFNNILTSILGHASLALLDLPTTAPLRNRLTSIETSARRAAELCQQMLAYSGKGRFTIKPVNLSELVEEMRGMLLISISKRAVLRHEREPDLPAVDADVTQMRQILINLITNASDALGGTDGEICISTGSLDYRRGSLGKLYFDEALPEGRCVFLEVSDTGCGMDAETQTKIFDPFFTTKFTGRGLGMAAVLGIVRGHRGAIKVESRLGQGAKFTIYLKASDRPAEPLSVESVSVVTDGGDGTILVVDDEEAVREFAALTLEHFGFRVMAAADGLEAVRIFRERHREISAVLLDLTMPRMNGEEVCRALKNIAPKTPIILSSGYNEQDAVRHFSNLSLSGFLQKPYGAADLAAKIRFALESKRTQESERKG